MYYESGLVLFARDWSQTYDDKLVGCMSGKSHPVLLGPGKSQGKGKGVKLYLEITAVLAHLLDQMKLFLATQDMQKRDENLRTRYTGVSILSLF